jgi:hypothetical protein
MVSHSPVMMSVEATSENFDAYAYLAQNGDVARAAGVETSISKMS